MAEPVQQQQQPTPEQQAQMQQVAQAGAVAAASGEDAGHAMRTERDRTQLKMSDEDINAIAERLNELNVKAFADQGAFEPPPPAVQPPPPETQAPPAQGPGEEAAVAAPEQPRKRTPAQRFMGIE